jgi:hypothetical protein
VRTLLPATAEPADPFDFGYVLDDSLISRPPYHQQVPSSPPPAGDPRTDLCGCPLCATEWTQDVIWFYLALSDPPEEAGSRHPGRS